MYWRPLIVWTPLVWRGGNMNSVANGDSIQPWYGLESRAQGSAILVSPDGKNGVGPASVLAIGRYQDCAALCSAFETVPGLNAVAVPESPRQLRLKQTPSPCLRPPLARRKHELCRQRRQWTPLVRVGCLPQPEDAAASAEDRSPRASRTGRIISLSLFNDQS
jgi:hypothetical protein